MARMEQQTFSSDLANMPAPPQAIDDAAVMLKFKRVLIHLVEIGDEFAELLRQEAKQSIQAQADSARLNPDADIVAPLVVPPAIVDAYERITRSVRRSMVMYQRLMAPPKAQSVDRAAARRRIIREVEDAIHSKAPKAEQEKLNVELVERLESPAFDDDLAHRSVGEIVSELCRDFGIGGLRGSQPFKRRTPADIAILNARAARRGNAARLPEIGALPEHPDDS